MPQSPNTTKIDIDIGLHAMLRKRAKKQKKSLRAITEEMIIAGIAYTNYLK